MSELIERLKSVQSKVSELKKQRDELQQSVVQFNTQREDQQGENHVLKTRIAELERENEVLRVARSFDGEQKGRPEAKQRINELVKEIDGCLALLKN